MREQLKDMKDFEKISGKLEILKKALSIDSIEEMNQLFQKLDEKQKAIKLKKIISGESNLNFDSNDMIDIRNEIIEILTDFMKTKTERKKALGIKLIFFFKYVLNNNLMDLINFKRTPSNKKTSQTRNRKREKRKNCQGGQEILGEIFTNFAGRNV